MTTTPWLDSYEVGNFFDEAFAPDGSVRPHYQTLVDRTMSLPPNEFARREHLRNAIFRSQGITFTVYSDDAGVERTFPMDLIPRIIPAQEWAFLEKGLIQRVSALNCFLADLYSGEQLILRDGIIPRWLVQSASGYVREAKGIKVPHNAHCLVAGIDLVRDSDGEYKVLEDNVRNPSGISYVLESRSALTRVMPRAFLRHQVRPVDHYSVLLLAALHQIAPKTVAEPTVAVLTPGMYNSAYFEHAFLARQMGVELVEGRDLVVDDLVVYMRTTRGLERVDVLYRRIDDSFLDPVVFRQDSTLGVPGILAAARAGNVTIANAVGNGVADDKAVYAYVPAIIKYYLGEEPILASVPTFLLWDDEQRHEALARLDQLVIKPVDGSGGYGLLMGPTASDEDIATFHKLIEENPRNFVAQEVISLSRHPTLVGDHFEGRHIDLRPFVISGESIDVIPGGLTRVALVPGSLIVNSCQGGGSKDTWVLEPEPGSNIDTEPPTAAELEAKRKDLDLAAAEALARSNQASQGSPALSGSTPSPSPALATPKGQ